MNRATGAVLLLALAFAFASGEAQAAPRALISQARPAAPAPPPLPLPPDAPPPAPILRSIEIHLPQGADPTGLAGRVGLKPGSALSRQELRRSIERLWATGRLADITVWQQSAGPGQVDLIIEASTRIYLDRVEFEGHKVLSTEALQKAAGIGPSRLEYYPELAARFVERLRVAYRRAGHAQVEVAESVVRTEKGETVLTLQIQEGPPIRLLGLTAAGDPQLPTGEILETLQLAPGAVFDHERLERGLEALRERYRREGYYRARLGDPEVRYREAGAEVELPISAGPRFEFRVRGNHSFDEATLLGVLAYDGEEPLDADLVEELKGRLLAWYRTMGYADARVRSNELRLSGGRRLRMTFTVEEGEPLRVVAVRFEGNAHFSERFLRERLEESLYEAQPEEEGRSEWGGEELLTGVRSRARGSMRPVDPTSVYDEGTYQRALGRILDLYRADGYLGALAEMPSVERDERRREARLTLRIREGVQTRVAGVEVTGAPEPGPLRAAAGMKEGQPLNGFEIESARQAIVRALGAQGYLFAKVEDVERFSADRQQAWVSFRVTQGPQVRVGQILIQGLGRTKETVVRSALGVEENELLQPETLAQSQRNLSRLGIFRSASVRMNEPEVPQAVKDLYVAVEERNTVSVTVGGGYSAFDGVRAFAEYNKINLLGRALQLQARAKVNYFNTNIPVLSGALEEKDGLRGLGRRLNVGLLYPRLLSLLPLEVGTHADLVHEMLIRPAYDFQRSAAIAGIDGVAKRVSASLQYEIETDDIERNKSNIGLSNKADIERQRFDWGTIHLHSVRPSVGLDLRDDPANPHRGAFFSATTEFVQSLGGSVEGPNGEPVRPFSLFLKASGQATAYVPLWKRGVLALSLKGGKVFPLDSEGRSRTIAPKRFFLGGAGTLRGFLDDMVLPEDSREALREEVRQCQRVLNKAGCSEAARNVMDNKQLTSLGGELFTLARGELRFGLAKELEGAVFVDAGNLWLDPRNFNPLQLRYATGVGVRWVTPIGPVAIDLGFNVNPDRLLNESLVVPHFSIGSF